LAKPAASVYQIATSRGDGEVQGSGRSVRHLRKDPPAEAITVDTEDKGREMATLDHAVPPGEDPAPYLEGEDDPRRRDFINIAAVAWAGVGGAIVVLPLINQMSPSADVLAQSTTEVDLSKIEAGQGVVTSFRKQPLFVRHLTPKEIEEANAVQLSELRDPQTLAERTKPGKANWLITLGVCTHLGCIPLGIHEGENRGQFGGYFCPCHGSQYDTAARIRKGPAPKNLAVPPYTFSSDTTVTVG